MPRPAPPKAQVVGAFGARGTGKTAWLRQQLAREPCLAIWDYKHDPRMSDWGQGHDSIKGLIQSLKAPTFTTRYLVNRAAAVDEQFSWFCKAAFQRGCMAIFVDELPMVTANNRAPDAWKECVNVGREYRTRDSKQIKWLSVYATAQRPSECDKSFIGNLDVVHTGRLGFANDAQVMSKSLGAPAAEVMALPDLHFLEKSADSEKYLRGVLSFANKSTAAKRRP